ncbi:MAG: porin, partial [Deltaproteobacteria bacterium]|nr:porin [Deltaproteobacteria bacterium]
SILITFVSLVAVLLYFSPACAVEAKLSGQVNQLIMWADNGVDNDIFIGDNENSSTRLRFTGSQKFNGVTAGIRIEFDVERNLSSTFDIPNTGDGTFRLLDRWFDATFAGTFGKVSLGKGSGAADGTAEADLSGTTVITYSGVNDTAGGFTFINRTTDLPSGTTVGDTRSNFDGLGRNSRLRYDTPKFAGFSFAGSFTNGNAMEVSGLYTGKFDSFGTLVAALGYVDTNERGATEFTQWGGSVSWLAPFGLNVTLSVGQRDPDAAGSVKADNGYVKVGWKFGSIHAASVEYGLTKDLDLRNDKSKNYGLAYVIKPWKSVEFYAAARLYELDRRGASLDDISQIMAGTRIKF